MKQTMQFSVGGEVVQVPQDEMDEFNAVAKQNGDTPEPVFSYRVSGKDGTADEVDVPKSQYGEFEKIAKERGDRIEPMRLLTLDDGTERLMSMNDLHKFFSSDELMTPDEKAQAAQIADIDAEDLKRLGGENLQEVAANEAIRGMKDIDPNDVPTAQPPMDGGEVMRQSNERFMRDMREGKVYDKSPTEAFFGELGRRMFTAEGIRETAQESGSARPYAYLNDLANSLVGGLLKGSAKIEEGFGRIWGEAGDALGNRGMKDAAQAMVSDAQAGQAAVERNLPTDMLDTKGPGAVNKVLQVGKNVAEMTGEFAPAAIPGVGQAYAASLVGAGTVNRYAQVYDEAIQHGLDPRKAEGLAFGAASVDALANMLLMGKFRGIWSGEKKAMADMAKKRFVQRALDVGLETAKVGGTMAANGAWQEIVDEGAQGATNPDWAKVGKVAFDQFIEGGMFHLVNSGAHHATRIDWSREPDGIPAGAARDMMESPEGRALIFCNSPQAAAQIFRARKNGEDVERRGRFAEDDPRPRPFREHGADGGRPQRNRRPPAGGLSGVQGAGADEDGRRAGVRAGRRDRVPFQGGVRQSRVRDGLDEGRRADQGRPRDRRPGTAQGDRGRGFIANGGFFSESGERNACSRRAAGENRARTARAAEIRRFSARGAVRRG